MAEQGKGSVSMEAKTVELAQEAVMVKSVPVAEGTPVIKGFDFNTGRDLDSIMAAAMTTGFQVQVTCGPAYLYAVLVHDVFIEYGQYESRVMSLFCTLLLFSTLAGVSSRKVYVAVLFISLYHVPLL